MSVLIFQNAVARPGPAQRFISTNELGRNRQTDAGLRKQLHKVGRVCVEVTGGESLGRIGSGNGDTSRASHSLVPIRAKFYNF